MSDAVQEIVKNLIAGQPRALARAISVVENESAGAKAVLQAIRAHVGKGLVVGFTGPPGAGKSTLINAFVAEVRKRNKTVGILAVDPSSPISGGAILGDRIRMESHGADAGVFTRSLSSRGHLGGLSRMAGRIVDVMDAAGKDVIVIETVGTGQSEVEIADIAETKVVISAPGLGDEVQSIKAGVLEIADILVVNKADQPMADVTVNHLMMMLSLRAHDAPKIPLISTSATKGDGVAELADAVLAHHTARRAAGLTRDRAKIVRRLIADTAAKLIRKRATERTDADMLALCEQVETGEIGLDEAVKRFLAS